MDDFIKRLNAWLVAHPLVRKPLNTLWQTFLSFFLLGLSGVISALLDQGLDAGKAALVALIVSAGAAAFSALKTYFVEASKASN